VERKVDPWVILEDKSILRFVLLSILPFELKAQLLMLIDRVTRANIFGSVVKDYYAYRTIYSRRRIKPWIDCALYLNLFQFPERRLTKYNESKQCTNHVVFVAEYFQKPE